MSDPLIDQEAANIVDMFNAKKILKCMKNGKESIQDIPESTWTNLIVSAIVGSDTKGVYTLVEKYFGCIIDEIMSYDVCIKSLPRKVCDSVRTTVLLLFAYYYLTFRDMLLDIVKTHVQMLAIVTHSLALYKLKVGDSIKILTDHLAQITGAEQFQTLIVKIHDTVKNSATSCAFYDWLGWVKSTVVENETVQYLYTQGTTVFTGWMKYLFEGTKVETVYKVITSSDWFSPRKWIAANIASMFSVSLISKINVKLPSLPVIAILITGFVLGTMYMIGVDNTLGMAQGAYGLVTSSSFDDWYKYLMVFPSYFYLNVAYKVPKALLEKIKTLKANTPGNVQAASIDMGVDTFLKAATLKIKTSEEEGLIDLNQLNENAYTRTKIRATEPGGLRGRLVKHLMQGFGVTVTYNWGAYLTMLLLFLYLMFELTILFKNKANISKGRMITILASVAAAGKGLYLMTAGGIPNLTVVSTGITTGQPGFMGVTPETTTLQPIIKPEYLTDFEMYKGNYFNTIDSFTKYKEFSPSSTQVVDSEVQTSSVLQPLIASTPVSESASSFYEDDNIDETEDEQDEPQPVQPEKRKFRVDKKGNVIWL